MSLIRLTLASSMKSQFLDYLSHVLEVVLLWRHTGQRGCSLWIHLCPYDTICITLFYSFTALSIPQRNIRKLPRVLTNFGSYRPAHKCNSACQIRYAQQTNFGNFSIKFRISFIDTHFTPSQSLQRKRQWYVSLKVHSHARRNLWHQRQ